MITMTSKAESNCPELSKGARPHGSPSLRPDTFWITPTVETHAPAHDTVNAGGCTAVSTCMQRD